MKRIPALILAGALSVGGLVTSAGPATAQTRSTHLIAKKKRVYPAAIKYTFMASCDATSHNNTKACGCLFGYLEKHATLTQFEADEDQIRAGDTPKIIKKAVAAC
jgi:hypothetical protein